jgi:hypothetical protein
MIPYPRFEPVRRPGFPESGESDYPGSFVVPQSSPSGTGKLYHSKSKGICTDTFNWRGIYCQLSYVFRRGYFTIATNPGITGCF